MSRLSGREKIFVEAVGQGKTAVEAAKLAGYTYPGGNGPALYRDNKKVRREIEEIQEKTVARMKLSRDAVQDMLLEAYDVARLQSDAGSMVRACGEINRMCGHYEPIRTEVKLTHEGKVLLENLEAMSDDDLLRIQAPDIIEGELVEDYDNE